MARIGRMNWQENGTAGAEKGIAHIYAPIKRKFTLSPLCAVPRRDLSVGAIPTRRLVVPAGSNRSGGGGNDTAEAFDGKGSFERFREQAGRNASER